MDVALIHLVYTCHIYLFCPVRQKAIFDVRNLYHAKFKKKLKRQNTS